MLQKAQKPLKKRVLRLLRRLPNPGVACSNHAGRAIHFTALTLLLEWPQLRPYTHLVEPNLHGKHYLGCREMAVAVGRRELPVAQAVFQNEGIVSNRLSHQSGVGVPKRMGRNLASERVLLRNSCLLYYVFKIAPTVPELWENEIPFDARHLNAERLHEFFGNGRNSDSALGADPRLCAANTHGPLFQIDFALKRRDMRR